MRTAAHLDRLSSIKAPELGGRIGFIFDQEVSTFLNNREVLEFNGSGGKSPVRDADKKVFVWHSGDPLDVVTSASSVPSPSKSFCASIVNFASDS
jgi:hypothetical protein